MHASALLRTALVGALLAAACLAAGADDAAQHARVRIEQGQVVAPASRRLVLPHGAEVSIHWQSDRDGELHLHGYDLTVRVRAGATVTTRLETRATGRFPVTSHGFGEAAGRTHGHGALMYVEVHPR